MYSPASVSAGLVGALMESMGVEDKIGQMIMVGFDDQSLTPELEGHLNEIHAGNVIFLGRNYANPQQMWEFTSALQRMASRRPAPVGLFTAIDQEGGVVARLLNGVTVFPGNMALGATAQAGYARRAAKVTAQEMLQLGLNMNLAPVLDDHTGKARNWLLLWARRPSRQASLREFWRPPSISRARAMSLGIPTLTFLMSLTAAKD